MLSPIGHHGQSSQFTIRPQSQSVHNPSSDHTPLVTPPGGRLGGGLLDMALAAAVKMLATSVTSVREIV